MQLSIQESQYLGHAAQQVNDANDAVLVATAMTHTHGLANAVVVHQAALVHNADLQGEFAIIAASAATATVERITAQLDRMIASGQTAKPQFQTLVRGAVEFLLTPDDTIEAEGGLQRVNNFLQTYGEHITREQRQLLETQRDLFQLEKDVTAEYRTNPNSSIQRINAFLDQRSEAITPEQFQVANGMLVHSQIESYLLTIFDSTATLQDVQADITQIRENIQRSNAVDGKDHLYGRQLETLDAHSRFIDGCVELVRVLSQPNPADVIAHINAFLEVSQQHLNILDRYKHFPPRYRVIIQEFITLRDHLQQAHGFIQQPGELVQFFIQYRNYREGCFTPLLEAARNHLTQQANEIVDSPHQHAMSSITDCLNNAYLIGIDPRNTEMLKLAEHGLFVISQSQDVVHRRHALDQRDSPEEETLRNACNVWLQKDD